MGVLDKMTENMQKMTEKAAIKLAIGKFIPAQVKEHLPKLIDVSKIAQDQLSEYLGNDEKRIMLAKDQSGNLRFIVIDTSKDDFLISKNENKGTLIKNVTLNIEREKLINEYVIPLIPKDKLQDIGKADENTFKGLFTDFTEGRIHIPGTEGENTFSKV